MKKLPYVEGTVFLVPLSTGGYGRGVVARMTKKFRGGLVGYFFGPRLISPKEFTMAGLIPSIAILRIKFGDLGLINGEWTICGTLPDWNRADWPVPEFVRKDPLSMKAWIVTYSDENPWLVVKETPTDYDSKLLSNGSSGYFAAAIHLRKAIEEIERHAE